MPNFHLVELEPYFSNEREYSYRPQEAAMAMAFLNSELQRLAMAMACR